MILPEFQLITAIYTMSQNAFAMQKSCKGFPRGTTFQV